MGVGSSRFGWLALLLLAALVLRLAAGYAWQQRLADERFAFADSQSYWVLAERLATGEPFGYGSARIFRTPGYPALLAPLFWLYGGEPPLLAVRVLNALLGTAAVAAIFWLGWVTFGERVAWTAAALAAGYPGAVATSILVLSESPFSPLMVAQLAVWALLCRRQLRGRGAWALAVGVLGGLATLVRPSWLLFTPAVAGAWWAGGLAGAGRQRLRDAGWILVGLCLVMMPWWVRNYQVSGQVVLTTLQVGASLYDGWNPQATGASDMSFVPEFAGRQAAADAAADGPLVGTFESRVDRRMRDAAVHWAADNPGRVVRLAGVKFLRMWNLWPNASELQGAAVRWTVAGTYLPLIVLALIGLYQHRRRGWISLLLVLPAGYLTLLHLVFVSSIRYREPAMLVLLVPAAAALLWLVDRCCCPVGSRGAAGGG